MQKKSHRVMVSSLQKRGFRKVADHLLVHKAQDDFWSVQSEGDGNHVVIRRLDDSDIPIVEG